MYIHDVKLTRLNMKLYKTINYMNVKPTGFTAFLWFSIMQLPWPGETGRA